MAEGSDKATVHDSAHGGEKSRLRLNPYGYRRLLLVAMGANRRLKPGTKIIIAALIFTLSLIIKSLVAVDLSPVLHTDEQPAGGMSLEYHREAVSITSGAGILIPDNLEPSDTSLLVHTPGYSIFLSAIYRVAGRNYFIVQLIQNLINSISAVLIFLIAARLLTWQVGAVAGILAASSHHLSYFSNFILPDSICALPILAAMYLLVKPDHRHKHGLITCAFAGTLIGASIWLRANALLMGPLVVVGLALISPEKRQTLKRVWTIIPAALLVIAPITIRNYLVYGEFIPLTASMGIVLWEGIGNAERNPFGAPKDDGEVIAQEVVIYGDPSYGEAWSRPDGIKRDRDRIRRSLGIIISHPIWFSGVMLKRMGEMLKYSAHAPLVYKSGDTGMIETGKRARRLSEFDSEEGRPNQSIALAIGESTFWFRPAARAIQRVTKETAQVFALTGALIALILVRRRSLYILIVPAYYLIFQSALHTEFRYTLPMHYFLFVLSAIVWVLLGYAVWKGILHLGGVYKRRPRKTLSS